jgi:ATP-dependent DNA ligase
MKFNNFRYIYPPRPKNAVNPDELTFWDNQQMIAQPKLNGSNCLIFTNGDKQFVMNRHNGRLTNFQLSKEEINSIFRGKKGEWLVLNGEYLNKNKQDESRVSFNHKFVIFDILVFKSDYLVGRTFQQRIEILDDIYGKEESEKDYLFKITDNIYRVKSYQTDFKRIYDDLTPIDLIEGLVLKRKNAKLEVGNTENNNTRSQLKFRKPTKNYKY